MPKDRPTTKRVTLAPVLSHEGVGDASYFNRALHAFNCGRQYHKTWDELTEGEQQHVRIVAREIEKEAKPCARR